ncbi:MAG: DUF423 domain-containing protein [Cyclobacteriaceae bacterium]
MKNLPYLQTAAVFGVLAVIFGAFGAHALAPFLVQHGREATYHTAVEYHFYHSLALVLTGILSHLFPENPKFQYSAWFFIAGICIFSGSLYLLCLTQISWLGAITPVGGLSFILGWVFLFLAASKGK